LPQEGIYAGLEVLIPLKLANTLLTDPPPLREGQATQTSGVRSPFLKEVLVHADLVVRNLFRSNLFLVNESVYGLSSIPGASCQIDVLSPVRR
jgi:hypothetical protein